MIYIKEIKDYDDSLNASLTHGKYYFDSLGQSYRQPNNLLVLVDSDSNKEFVVPLYKEESNIEYHTKTINKGKTAGLVVYDPINKVRRLGYGALPSGDIASDEGHNIFESRKDGVWATDTHRYIASLLYPIVTENTINLGNFTNLSATINYTSFDQVEFTGIAHELTPEFSVERVEFNTYWSKYSIGVDTFPHDSANNYDTLPENLAFSHELTPEFSVERVEFNKYINIYKIDSTITEFTSRVDDESTSFNQELTPEFSVEQVYFPLEYNHTLEDVINLGDFTSITASLINN